MAVISDIKPEFPILSFRPEKDILVPPEQIDEVFKDQGLRNLNAVVLKGCGHLTALKQDPTQYKAVLRQFLSQF